MLRAGAIMIQYHGATVLRCYIAIGFNMLLGQQQAENRKRKLGLSSLELWVYMKSFIVVTLLGGMAGTLLGTVGPKWVLRDLHQDLPHKKFPLNPKSDRSYSSPFG